MEMIVLGHREVGNYSVGNYVSEILPDVGDLQACTDAAGRAPPRRGGARPRRPGPRRRVPTRGGGRRRGVPREQGFQ